MEVPSKVWHTSQKPLVSGEGVPSEWLVKVDEARKLKP